MCESRVFMFVVSRQWAREVGATRETFPRGEPSLAGARAARFGAERECPRVLGRQGGGPWKRPGRILLDRPRLGASLTQPQPSFKLATYRLIQTFKGTP